MVDGSISPGGPSGQPPLGGDIDKEIVEYNKLEKQLQLVVAQIYQFEAQKIEMQKALELIEQSKEPVYKSVGGVLVKVERDKALADLKKSLELLDIKLKKLKEQEESLQNKFNRLAKQLEERMSHGGLPPTSA